MTETLRLQATCSRCFKTWWPFGRFTAMQVPHIGNVQCPKCGNIEEFTWHDSQTKKIVYNHLQQQNNRQLTYNSDEQSKRIDDLENKNELLQNKIDSLEDSQRADRKYMQTLRDLVDLVVKNEINDLKSIASDHNFNLNNLQEQITRLEELLERISKWQDGHDGR